MPKPTAQRLDRSLPLTWGIAAIGARPTADSVAGVKDRDAYAVSLGERLRLEYRQVVTTPSGRRFVVSASPRSLAGDPDYWPLPWPVLLGWVALRQWVFILRRQPGWRVEVTPAWEPTSGRIVAIASKADAYRRADAEAAELGKDPA